MKSIIHIQIVEFKWDCFTIQDIVFFKNQNFYSFNLNKNIYLSLFAMLILNRYNLSFFSFFFYNKIQKWDPYSTSSIFLWKIWILRLFLHHIAKKANEFWRSMQRHRSSINVITNGTSTQLTSLKTESWKFFSIILKSLFFAWKWYIICAFCIQANQNITPKTFSESL